MIVCFSGPKRLPALASLMALILSCSPKPASLLERYVSAQNSHNIEAVMACYAEDITFEIVGVWEKSGKDAVRRLAEWDSVTNIHMVISDLRVFADTIIFDLVEINNWFISAGIEEIHYPDCRIIFQDGLIKKIAAEMSPTTFEAFNAIWPAIIEWLSQHRSQQLAALLPAGEFVYNTETAKEWLALLKDWRLETARP